MEELAELASGYWDWVKRYCDGYDGLLAGTLPFLLFCTAPFRRSMCRALLDCPDDYSRV